MGDTLDDLKRCWVGVWVAFMHQTSQWPRFNEFRVCVGDVNALQVLIGFGLKNVVISPRETQRNATGEQNATLKAC